MSKTSKTKTYEVKIYRPGQTKWKTVEIVAESFTVVDGVARFWIDDTVVATFPKEGWGSVIKK